MQIIAVIRASIAKAFLSVYVDGERVAIDRETFAKRAKINADAEPGKVPTLEIGYPGRSQYVTTYLAIVDAMKYLAPFQDAGHEIHLMTNQKTVVKQLTGAWKTEHPELVEIKNVIVSLNTHSNKMSLQAIEPDKALSAIELP